MKELWPKILVVNKRGDNNNNNIVTVAYFVEFSVFEITNYAPGDCSENLTGP